jgi:AcrR family transcriptional regulator
MTSPRSQREALLELTIDAAATRGLDGVSLRAIASDAGSSTTAIFQHYSGKAELIAYAVRAAIDRDEAFHRDMRQQAGALVQGHLGFADFIVSYVEFRAVNAPARFLAEVLVTAPEYPECLQDLVRWHDGRRKFWAELVDAQGIASNFADIVADYVLMEEYYAFALVGQVQYRLLLQETARALCDAVFHDGQSSIMNGRVSLALGVTPYSARAPSTDGGHAVAGKLLDAAVHIINRAGIGAINQRAIAKAADVSTAMISYHFKDMRNFTTQAIWHALVQDIPVQLDPDQENQGLPSNLADWLANLDVLLQSRAPRRDEGFYVSFSRLTGEASLMAGRNPALLPVIQYLRGLEGWGTYRVGRAIEPLAQLIGRDHAAAFGVWIKAEAILRGAGLVGYEEGTDRLTRAAGLILPSETGKHRNGGQA